MIMLCWVGRTGRTSIRGKGRVGRCLNMWGVRIDGKRAWKRRRQLSLRSLRRSDEIWTVSMDYLSDPGPVNARDYEVSDEPTSEISKHQVGLDTH